MSQYNMVKIFNDKQVEEHCKLWRPIPLFLQEPILAVPDGIRKNPYTDLVDVAKTDYVAPQSVHVMAQNAQSLFNIIPNSYIESYSKLVKKEMMENNIEMERAFTSSDLGDDDLVADTGTSGPRVFDDLDNLIERSTELGAEQVEAMMEGTGLIKVKRGRGPDRKARIRRTKREISADVKYMALSGEEKEELSRKIQPELIPGLVTQTRTRSEGGQTEVTEAIY